MNALAGRFENGLQERSRGTLAVCPGNMNDRRQRLMRVAELCQKPLDAPKRQVDQLGMQEFELGEELIARRHGAAFMQGQTLSGVRLD